MDTQNTFRIGDLAHRYGVSAEAIRQWERRGLIPPSRRTPGGHRRYGAEHRRAIDAYILPCAAASAVTTSRAVSVERTSSGLVSE